MVLQLDYGIYLTLELQRFYGVRGIDSMNAQQIVALDNGVAPLAGAWIETCWPKVTGSHLILSHLSRVRGLKP